MAPLNREKPLFSPLPTLLAGVLWVSVLGSALGVVFSTFEGRQRLNELETLRREAGHLQVEWGQYLLEQSTWAAYSRIEQMAVGNLSMRVPEPRDIIMVKQ